MSWGSKFEEVGGGGGARLLIDRLRTTPLHKARVMGPAVGLRGDEASTSEDTLDAGSKEDALGDFVELDSFGAGVKEDSLDTVCVLSWVE